MKLIPKCYRGGLIQRGWWAFILYFVMAVDVLIHNPIRVSLPIVFGILLFLLLMGHFIDFMSRERD